MKIIAITSDHLRHKYVVNELIKIFNVIAVFAEEKAFTPEIKAENDEDKKVIIHHFNLREDIEERFFGTNIKFNLDEEIVYFVKRGEINEPHIVNKIKELAPDAIAVYGSGILKKSIIDICPNSIINIHLGLSPYYRGSGTNFWPFVNKEPEYSGVTIHYIDEGIDTGRIIHQGYSPIERRDSFHDIGCKTIKLAARLFVKTFRELIDNSITEGSIQMGEGKLYYRRDFNAVAVRQLYQLFDEGLIDQYLEDVKNGKRKMPIIIK